MEGFPGSSDSKASACNVGDLGMIPRLGRSPGEGNGNPLQYSCLENSIVVGYSPWDPKELDMTEQLHWHIWKFLRKQVRTGHGTTDWFHIGKGVHQCCILLPCSFNLYAEFSSVQFTCSVMSDSLRPYESQHTRPPCPSSTPGVYSNSCPSSR